RDTEPDGVQPVRHGQTRLKLPRMNPAIAPDQWLGGCLIEASPTNQPSGRGTIAMNFISTLRSSTLGVALLLAAGGIAAHADAIDDITAAGQINVGIFSDFPPFSSASADMSIKGYDIDVAQAIAD